MQSLQNFDFMSLLLNKQIWHCIFNVRKSTYAQCQCKSTVIITISSNKINAVFVDSFWQTISQHVLRELFMTKEEHKILITLNTQNKIYLLQAWNNKMQI